MPKVKPLTQRKRREAAIERNYTQIADGLSAMKNREQITQDDIGKRFGMTRQTVAKLLRRESVKVDFPTALAIIDAAGYRLKSKEADVG